VTNASTLLPHPALDCGHRAVFIDRLDVGVVVAGSAALGDGVAGLGEQRRLVPFATVVMHMRNRAYDPFTGRFLQRDMNATAAVVLGSMAHSGRGLAAGVSAFDAMELYRDGGSLYAYLGSSPYGRRDELGLFFGLRNLINPVGYAVMGGVRGIRGGLQNMLENYAINMEEDIDWAMDWSRRDDDYSRLENSWVSYSFVEGMSWGLRDQAREIFDDITFGLLPGDWINVPSANSALSFAGLPKLKPPAIGVPKVKPAIPGVKKAVPNPYGKRGGPAHVGKVDQVENYFTKTANWRHIAGGTKKEQKFGNRFPDLIFQRPDGSLVAFQIGRATTRGLPIAREARALADLRATGRFAAVVFVEYKP